MKNRVKKLSAILVSSVAVLSSSPLAFCSPEVFETKINPGSKTFSEEEIIKISENCVRAKSFEGIDPKLTKNTFNIGPYDGSAGYDNITTYVAYLGELCPLDGFAGNDICNNNPKIKTLIYTSASFNAERYNQVLFLNGVMQKDGMNPQWKSKIVCNNGKDEIFGFRMEFENKPEGKKIIFCFNPLVMMHRFRQSSTINTVINYYNELLEECGIDRKFSINYKTFCEVNKLISDSFCGLKNIEYNGEKYDNIKNLMEDYNFKVLIFKSDISMMRFCGDESLVNVGLQGPVYEIGEYAFNCCKNLKNIVLPSFVMKIGDGAFQYCESLESINIPEHVTKIGRDAFNGCKNLKNIEYKGAVYSSVEDFMKDFNTKVLEVKLDIGNGQFFNRNDLKNVEIKGAVHKIGHNAFAKCVNLESIKFSDTVECVGESLFSGCYSLKSIEYKGKIYQTEEEFRKAVNTRALAVEEEKIEDDQFAWRRDLRYVKIPSNVESIGSGSFRGCINLRSVILPKTIKNIGPEAFVGCVSLKSINIPTSVEQIGVGAFSFCDNLKYIEYQGKVYKSIREFLNEFVGGNKVFPEDIFINFKQFSQRQDLKRVDVSSPVYMIGPMAFEKCPFLEKVTLPNTIKIIGDRAFVGCVALKEINIPNSIKTIKSNAFEGCCSLNKIKYNGKIYSSAEEFFEAFNGK